MNNFSALLRYFLKYKTKKAPLHERAIHFLIEAIRCLQAASQEDSESSMKLTPELFSLITQHGQKPTYQLVVKKGRIMEEKWLN